MKERKNFIHINEEFTCQNCGKQNPKLAGSCRNHCKFCLYSLHVDKDIPGDRESSCKALMSPLQIDHDTKKGFKIIHKCTKCGKIIPNKSAEDDDFDEIIKVSNRGPLHELHKNQKH